MSETQSAPPSNAATLNYQVESQCSAVLLFTFLQTHVFYYPWYGTPENDGAYFHWNHEVR
jgi:hypothetical protein